MAEGKLMGRTYHDEVEALKQSGVSNAEAVREIARRYKRTENAVRAGIHQYRSRHGLSNGASAGAGGRPRGRRSSRLSVDDYVMNARRALESARDLVEREVDQAKRDLDVAQSRYDEAVAAVAGRKADIERKLAALS